MGIVISDVRSNFEREPLKHAFGFKGGYVTEIWQTVALLRSESGVDKIGLGTLNTLWSDPRVFASCSEAAGNALMYAVMERALQMIRGRAFSDPVSLQEELLPELYDYARSITGKPDLRLTFVLNALVAVDNAAWLVYARERGFSDFDAMIPDRYRPALSGRNSLVACVPLINYATPVDEIEAMVRQGFFLLKIKLGHPGDEAQMLERDMARFEEIHRAVGNAETEHTENGRIPYYLDMNGRYGSKEVLLRLLDFAERIGALEQILIVEEPFPEELEVEVGDLPVRIAADESAHTDEDALKRIEMGYGAIALKPIAKTLSMTLKIAEVAHRRGVPCFCADLTVNPILVEWNKNVAARLGRFPGLRLGLMETNGHQNYREWQRMMSYHPCPGAPWVETREGMFHLDDDFYRRSGCIFETPRHYYDLVRGHRV